jgi:hypothetical protein
MCVKFAGVGSSNVLRFVGPPEKRNARARVSEKINLQSVCVGQSEREIICVCRNLQFVCVCVCVWGHWENRCVCVGPLGKQVCLCVWGHWENRCVCVEKKPEGLRESSKQTAKVGFCLGIQQENHRGCLLFPVGIKQSKHR